MLVEPERQALILFLSLNCWYCHSYQNLYTELLFVPHTPLQGAMVKFFFLVFYNKKLKNYTSALILDSSDIDTS